MVDHSRNIGDNADDKRLQTYRENDLRHQRIRRLTELYEVNTTDLTAITMLSWVLRGAICCEYNGAIYTLDESMKGWWHGYKDLRDRLLDKGLIETCRDKQHRLYYQPTNEAYEMLPQTWRWDVGESFKHRITVGRTAMLYRLLGHKVAMYPEIDNSGTHADLRVYPDDEQARRSMDIPGTKPIAVEVMTDHHNTQLVEDRFRTMEDAYEDGLWVFENRDTLNKWVRRLQNRDVMDFRKQYAWSSGTPMQVSRPRIRETDYSGMQDALTFARVRRQLANIEEKTARIAKGLHVPPRCPDSTQAMHDEIKRVLNG